MTSYNDYIAAKRIFTVNTGLVSCNNDVYNSGSLYNGSPYGGIDIPGPTGPPGDTYISYFKKIFYANSLYGNAIIGIKIDSGLAYLPDMNVKIQAVLIPPETELQYFYGSIQSYDKSNGVLVLYNVSNISTNFPYGISTEYIANIDNTGQQGPQGPPGTSVVLQATEHQTTVNNTISTQPVVGIASDVIIGNSLTFAAANATKVISYGAI